MMTPAARKITRSRAGKGEPSRIASGSERMPASVMAPRTPATDPASLTRKPNVSAARPFRRATMAVTISLAQIQMKRSPMRQAVSATTMRIGWMTG